MSRIGRKPIEVPAGVNLAIAPGRVQVNGPLGELSQAIPQRMNVEQRDGEIVITRPTDRGEDRALQPLRAAPRRLQEVRAVPDLPAGARSPRRDSRHDEK